MLSDVSKRGPCNLVIQILHSDFESKRHIERFGWQHLYLKNFQTCLVLQTAALFETSIELEKGVFVLLGVYDKEKNLSPHEESRKELHSRPLCNRPHSQ